MEYRTLEISLQQAKDLQNVNLLFTKMDVYTVVSVSGGDKNSKQKIKSPVDHDGGSNPTWNFPMKFTVEESLLQQNRLTLDFKLICERALGDRDIGEVIVPIKELLDSPTKGGPEGKGFVSYQVKRPSGRPKGQLTFSYQFNEKITGAATAPPYAAANLPTAPMYPTANLPTAPLYPPSNLPSGKDNGDAVMAYPAGPSSGYQVSGGYYPPPPPQYGYGYPPQQPTYGYPPQQSGYGYPPPPAPGYGYPPPPGYSGYQTQGVQPPRKQNKMGLGLGAGLLGGALGGLLIGDMISDGGGFGGGFDCGGF